MKIIHTADLHLGSALNSLPFALAAKRRRELINRFQALVDFANQNEVSAVLIAGDLFDINLVQPALFNEVHAIFSKYPHIEYYLLVGNHDSSMLSSFSYGDFPQNVHTFTNSFDRYDLKNVAIYGTCSCDYNTINSKFDSNKFNILLAHASLTEKTSLNAYELNLKLLENKNINYLALGHYHSYSSGTFGISSNKNVWCYSGCLEGRGFDETGKKGFVLLDINDNDFSYEFIEFSSREIFYLAIDVSGLSLPLLYSQVQEELNSNGVKSKDIVKISLIGKRNQDFSCQQIEEYYNGKYFHFVCENKTTFILNEIEKQDILVKGFIQEVEELNLDNDLKTAVLSYGLEALTK